MESPCQRTDRGYRGGAQGARVELLALRTHLVMRFINTEHDVQFAHRQPLSGMSAGTCRGRDDFDGTPRAWGPSNAPVTGEECGVEHLGQRNVGRVVDREVLSQFPAARDEHPVIDPLHRQGPQVVQGEGHPPRVQLAAAGEASPYRNNLEVDQAGRREVLALEAGAKVVSVLVVVQQRDGQDAGIKDEHARTAARSPRPPRKACPQPDCRPVRAPLPATAVRPPG